MEIKFSGIPARSLKERIVRLLFWAVASGSMAAFAVVLLTYLYYAPTVPDFRTLADYQPKVGSKIYSADNQLIGEFAAERRVLVPFERIPKQLFNAFIAAEDKRFYSHGGMDLIGMTQAIVDKLLHPKNKLRGASTITQQVAKSLLATNESYETATERSIARKVREAILARRLEHSLSKDDILYLYVNQIFLGHKAYGVQAAAEHYFRKNVWELSLAEMATLAGLPQRPSDYSPVSRPEAALARRKYVLRRMLEEEFVSQKEHDDASVEKLAVFPRNELYLEVAPYYTEQVRREMIERYGERALLEEGLRVYTALDIEKQALGRRAIDDGLLELDKRQGYRGPLAHLEKNKWDLFIERYRQELVLVNDKEPELAPGSGPYLALVRSFDSNGLYAEVDVAGRKMLLPVAGMRWARKPDPTERVDLHYLEDVRKILKTGDVVAVMPTTREQLAKDPHGWEAVPKIPEEGDLVRLEQEPIAQAAMMSVDPRSGYVKVQIGGYNFEDSTFNRAMQACREPGSAFKPIVYSAAIDKLDYTASTPIDDKPIVFDDPDNEMRWKPANAGEEFRGKLPMRTCIKDSINTPAIRVAEAVGIEDMIKNARRLGVTSKLKRELGTALGSSCVTLFELMNVYTAINQYGERRDLKFIRRVVDRFGHVLEDHSTSWDPLNDFGTRLDRAYEMLVTPPRQALDQQTAFITLSLLKNVIASGTGMGAQRLGLPTAGKTGTTNDSYDAWFMGFTHDIVTGVWVGHDKKERPLGVNEQGGRTALPIWTDFMVSAVQDYTSTTPKKIAQADFDPPPGVVRAAIDPDTGYLARPGSGRSVYEYYRAGTEPTDVSPDRHVLSPDQMNVFDADTPL